MRAPTKYDETLVELDADLLTRYAQACRAQEQAEQEIREALAHAPRRKNPKYREEAE